MLLSSIALLAAAGAKCWSLILVPLHVLLPLAFAAAATVARASVLLLSSIRLAAAVFAICLCYCCAFAASAHALQLVQTFVLLPLPFVAAFVSRFCFTVTVYLLVHVLVSAHDLVCLSTHICKRQAAYHVPRI